MILVCYCAIMEVLIYARHVNLETADTIHNRKPEILCGLALTVYVLPVV